MKEKFKHILSWANREKRPKKFLYFFLGFLLLSSIFAIVKEIYFPSKITFTTIPKMYIESDKEKAKFQLKEAELEKVVKEIYRFHKKQQEVGLTKSDSVRIEYLYNEYKKLKNET
ncbi:hypothetical protein PG593_03605 [Riemerella anatipestifer]|uniref:hypothetical protein n=1 Tax=Riemerella anatipestifer TaxID=34085 RepID=UPI00069A0D33|nr:hypothetical protein [Riemerella anatipestifer]MDR7693394.1 hypothetical protein [Riemerella anatipestifer]MDY3528865.1 hypothetical protein [Riemerella anatipestifer]MDY3538080.1 hypothetical protein [Riemerella anatipestifer]